MNRLFLSFFCFFLCAGAAVAETFEKLIETQPPETEKNFWGITDMILDKTNNFLDGVLGVLDGVSTGNIEAIADGIVKGTETFTKYRTEHKETLQRMLAQKEAEVAALQTGGGKGVKLAKAYLELGNAAMDAGAFPRAQEAFAEALRIAQSLGSTSRSLQLEILLSMADCAYAAYDTDYMLTVRDRIRDLTQDKTVGDINQRVDAILASGRADLRLGNYSAAIQAMGDAFALAQTEPSFNAASPHSNLLMLEILKKFPEVGAAEPCLELLEGFVGDNSPIRSQLTPDILSQMYVVKADCHSRLAQHAAAFNNIFKARDIIQKAYPDGSIAELEYLVTLGDLLRRNAIAGKNSVRNSYTDKGVMYHLNGCRLLASRIWGNEKAGVNPWLRRINSKLALAAVTDCLINTAMMENYTKPSMLKVAQVLANKATYTDSESRYQMHSSKADESRKLARKLYRSELEYMRDKIRTDFLSMDESQRADYMAAMSELVNDIYNFAELDKTDKESAGMVYDATLLSKSVLLSFSRSLSSAVKTMNDPALLAKLEELNSLRREYVRLEQKGDFVSSVTLRSRAGEIERELQHAIAGTNPGEFMATTWKTVKSGLPKNDSAVEFYTFTDNLFNTPGSSERIVALASNKNPRVFVIQNPGEIRPADAVQLGKLYSVIWAPLEKEKYIKAGGTVYFAPAGRWSSVPLEYLPTGKEDMNDRYTMVRVSTTRQRPEVSAPEFTDPVLFGGLDYNLGLDDMAEIREEIAETGMRGPLDNGLWNRLPGTEVEVNDIASILSGNSVDCTLVTGADGIEERFKALSGGQHGIVHIATHGYYCPPARQLALISESARMDEAMDHSGLVFSGVNQYLAGNNDGSDGLDNGLLTAREIALMDLSSTDLVVMSACETGNGRSTAEGVQGLQRGFKLAGANTLVMSLWKVNDQATAAMMEAFYRNLSSGMDKRSAFYAARAELRKGTYKNAEGKDVPGTDPLIGDAFVIMD